MPIRLTRRRGIVALAVLAAAGILGGAVAVRVAGKAEDAEALRAKAAPTLEFAAADLTGVEARPLARWLPVSGALQPVRQAVVKARVSGEVREVDVREGESVRAAQVIARFDTADLDARVAERLGAFEAAKAQFALAEKTRAMNLRLLNEKFISQNAFDGSDSSVSVAQGTVKSAEAQLRLAQNARREATVTAPLAGIVAKRHVQPGEKVALDAPLVTIVDLRDLELAAIVPTVDVPELKVGMPVELAVDGYGERRFTGRIERINPATEPGTRSILVFVGLANADASLKSGMSATGRIRIASSGPVPSLPAEAVRTDAGQNYVWTIENGKLARRLVVVGRRDEEAGRVEITTPLPAGAPVLAARFDKLKEGAPVLVKAPGASSNAASPAPAAAGKPAG